MTWEETCKFVVFLRGEGVVGSCKLNANNPSTAFTIFKNRIL